MLFALFPLNAALAAAGSALSGVIDRDNPAARVHSALDCGLFGFIVHFVFAITLVGLLSLVVD